MHGISAPYLELHTAHCSHVHVRSPVQTRLKWTWFGKQNKCNKWSEGRYEFDKGWIWSVPEGKRVKGIRLKRDGSKQERLKGKGYVFAICIHQRESLWRFGFWGSDSEPVWLGYRSLFTKTYSLSSPPTHKTTRSRWSHNL